MSVFVSDVGPLGLTLALDRATCRLVVLPPSQAAHGDPTGPGEPVLGGVIAREHPNTICPGDALVAVGDHQFRAFGMLACNAPGAAPARLRRSEVRALLEPTDICRTWLGTECDASAEEIADALIDDCCLNGMRSGAAENGGGDGGEREREAGIIAFIGHVSTAMRQRVESHPRPVMLTFERPPRARESALASAEAGLCATLTAAPWFTHTVLVKDASDAERLFPRNVPAGAGTCDAFEIDIETCTLCAKHDGAAATRGGGGGGVQRGERREHAVRRGDRIAALNGTRFPTLRAFRVGGGGTRVGLRELRAVIAGLPLRQTWLRQFMSGVDAAATEDDDIAGALLAQCDTDSAGRLTSASAAGLLQTLRAALVAKVSATRFPRYLTLERRVLPRRRSPTTSEGSSASARGEGGGRGVGAWLRIERRGVAGTCAVSVSEQIVERFAEIASTRVEERAEQLARARAAAGALAERVAAVEKRCAAVRTALRRLEKVANAIEGA